MNMAWLENTLEESRSISQDPLPDEKGKKSSILKRLPSVSTEASLLFSMFSGLSTFMWLAFLQHKGITSVDIFWQKASILYASDPQELAGYLMGGIVGIGLAIISIRLINKVFVKIREEKAQKTLNTYQIYLALALGLVAAIGVNYKSFVMFETYMADFGVLTFISVGLTGFGLMFLINYFSQRASIKNLLKVLLFTFALFLSAIMRVGIGFVAYAFIVGALFSHALLTMPDMFEEEDEILKKTIPNNTQG